MLYATHSGYQPKIERYTNILSNNMIIPISLVVFLLIAWAETALQEFLLRKPVKAQKAQKSESFFGRDPKGLPTCRHDDWYTCICKLTKEQIKQVEDEYKKQIWKKI